MYFHEAEILELNDLIEGFYEEQRVLGDYPGLSIAIQLGPKKTFLKNYGTCNKHQKVNSNTIFRIGSLTKIFTAVLLLQARDSKLCSLDDSIVKYLSSASTKGLHKDFNRITIRQIVSHLSGLPREASFDYWRTRDFPDRQQFLRCLNSVKPVYPPLHMGKYSNLGYALLGIILENIYGKDYFEILEEKIIIPLNLRETGFYKDKKYRKNYANGFEKENNKIVKRSFTSDLKSLAPAGGMYSSILDLMIFLNIHTGTSQKPQILCQTSIQEMQNPMWISSDFRSSVCMGWWACPVSGLKLLYHGGSINSFSSFMGLVPQLRLCVIFLANMRCDYNRLINNIIGFSKKIDLNSVEAKMVNAEEDATRYAGNYLSPIGDTFYIKNKGHLLFLRKKGDPKVKIELIHTDENVFLMRDGFLCGEELRFHFSDDGMCEFFFAGSMKFINKIIM